MLELLLTDETNPRSVAFQLRRMEHNIERLPRVSSDGPEPEELQIVRRVLYMMRSAKLEDLAERDAKGEMEMFERFIRDMKASLWDISDELTARYLSHLTPSRLLASL